MNQKVFITVFISENDMVYRGLSTVHGTLPIKISKKDAD